MNKLDAPRAVPSTPESLRCRGDFAGASVSGRPWTPWSLPSPGPTCGGRQPERLGARGPALRTSPAPSEGLAPLVRAFNGLACADRYALIRLDLLGPGSTPEMETDGFLQALASLRLGAPLTPDG